LGSTVVSIAKIAHGASLIDRHIILTTFHAEAFREIVIQIRG